MPNAIESPPAGGAEALAVVGERLYRFKSFATSVTGFFMEHPRLSGKPPVIHSVRTRMKDTTSLAQKVARKSVDHDPITPANVFQRITDIAGVRVLHLYQQQFSTIHKCIEEQIAAGDWALHEPPRAYTWDPESKAYFEGFGLEVHVKESFYTSIHYVVRPRPDSDLSCEIQVRTLFEEIWGEIDHAINYPAHTQILACREQLRVLARLVGAGSRLADSIFRAFDEYGQQLPAEPPAPIAAPPAPDAPEGGGPAVRH